MHASMAGDKDTGALGPAHRPPPSHPHPLPSGEDTHMPKPRPDPAPCKQSSLPFFDPWEMHTEAPSTLSKHWKRPTDAQGGWEGRGIQGTGRLIQKQRHIPSPCSEAPHPTQPATEGLPRGPAPPRPALCLACRRCTLLHASARMLISAFGL